MKGLKSGIYLLPNLFTTAALFFGFFAVVMAIEGHFETSAISIFLAMIFDGLDGRVARLTNSTSAFGEEYDSLADMVSFGVAPAVLAYQWSLNEFGNLGFVAAFVFVAGAALRLARFNTQIGIADKRYFQGLPSPAAASVIAGYVWWMVTYTGQPILWLESSLLVLTALTGLLMVSNFRYSSFKEFNLRNKVPFVAILLVALGFAIVSLAPQTVLAVFFIAYAFSGPILTLVQLKKTRQLRRQKNQVEEAAVSPLERDPTEEQKNKE
jgi:CDP-diacylglycerol--serine O-phosphatidyltransferase